MKLWTTGSMPRWAGPRWAAWAIGLAGVCCAALPAWSQALIDAGGQANLMHQHQLMRQQSGSDGAAADAQKKTPREQAALPAEARRSLAQHRRELRPEYERRVRRDGRPAADAWLRATAERLGRREGQAMQRPNAGAAGGPPAAAPAKAPGGDRRCARMVTRHRHVANLSGGPMQMIMVTECVPG